MSSFEWVELETLTNDIETARSRLADARKRNNQGVVAMLETEITRAEKRRTQLLAHISTNVGSAPGPAPRAAAREGARVPQDAAPVAEASPGGANREQPGETSSAAEPAPPPKAKDGASSNEAPASAAEALEGEGEGEAAPLSERDERSIASGAAARVAALEADSAEGGNGMWNQLTPNDLDRAKRELDERRAEMLARHAEELKGLNADQTQLETLEQAIGAFLRKFNPAPQDGEVVKLDQERGLRQQGSS